LIFADSFLLYNHLISFETFCAKEAISSCIYEINNKILTNKQNSSDATDYICLLMWELHINNVNVHSTRHRVSCIIVRSRNAGFYKVPLESGKIRK